jgi:BirA family biotin operon repressor/biotin-[acetyl-CoA-carboxylase] ligase
MEYGTHGRVWHTDEENNIAFSFYINTNCNPKNLEEITIEIANILVQTFNELYKISLGIKFPNDITYNSKKIGGILTQTKLEGEKVKSLVIGIGINTNQKNFATDIVNIASSIKNEFNITINNEEVIKRFLELFERVLLERKIIE